MNEMKSNTIDFEITAQRNADMLFLNSYNFSLTYGDSLKIINNLFSKFINKIKYDEPIGIIASNSPEYVILVLTLWRLGAVPVPLNPALRNDEIIERLNRCKIKKVFVSPSVIIKDNGIEVLPLPDLKNIPDDISNSCSKKKNKTAVMIFTSGSSGKAKCVEITFKNLIANFSIIKSEFKIELTDSWLLSLPIFHIGGFAIISRTILSNGILCIPKSLKAENIIESITAYEPSNISLVSPTLYHLIENKFRLPKKCKNIFVGGGKIDRELVRKALELNYPLHLVYGSTETTSMISAVSNELLLKNINSGAKIFNGVDIYVDANEHQNYSKTSIGEVIIKSPTVADGYFKDGIATKRKFSKDIFKSGDSGFIDDDGLLHILGRIDDTVISGGENISTTEIEQKLMIINGVKDCVVIGLSDSKWGEKIIAAIVREKNSNILDNEIITFAKEHLPNFQVPKEIFFIEDIPRNELGKLQRAELLKIITPNK